MAVYRDSAGVLRETDGDSGGTGGGATAVVGDLDTDGNSVPTYKPHTFTYDSSGNLVTDTVVSGNQAWVRTYTYINGVQATDSGWVKQ